MQRAPVRGRRTGGRPRADHISFAMHPSLQRAWLFSLVCGAVAVLASVSLDRFVEWDEAVFLSQSGSLVGGAPPSFYAASREIGSAGLLRVLRILPDDLLVLRAGWAIVSVGVAGVGFRVLGRRLGGLVGPVAFLGFVGGWIGLLYVGSFYGSQLGAMFAVLGTGLYLGVRDADDARTRDLQGVLLGLALAAAFWFRHIESAIVLVVLLGHALVVRPRHFWPRSTGAVARAAVAFTAAFVIPWCWDTILRYGSIPARLEQARGQDWPTGGVNRTPDYVRAIAGDSATYEAPAGGGTALIVLAAVCAAAVAVAVVAVLFTVRRDRGVRLAVSGPGILADRWALMTALAAASFAFFFFYASNVQDRYASYGLAFTAVLGGLAVDVALRRVRWRRPLAVTLAVAGLFWLVGQSLVLRTYEGERERDGAATAEVDAAILELLDGRTCSGVTRYGAPQYQIASGCEFRRTTDLDEIAARVRSERPRHDVLVAVWPSGELVADDLPGDGWRPLQLRPGADPSVDVFVAEAPGAG